MKLTDGNFHFIQTTKMSQERQKLGYGASLPDFVVESYKSEETYSRCLELINEADALIVGSAPEEMIRERLKAGKLVIRYSERLFKNKKEWLKLPYRIVKFHRRDLGDKNVYLLCSSAYSAWDYSCLGMYKGKTFKWGYFPPTKRYENVEELMENKKPASILWVARLLGLKHPDASILCAERLVKEGYKDFRLNVIGIGPLESELKALIKEKGLENYVSLLGAMKPEEVRKHMEESKIFLFTSDFNEGWGAVLNEAMNSGCAVVASHAIGSVPFLLKDKDNGLIYKNGDIDSLYSDVKWLLDNPKKADEMGKKAYETLANVWNAETAASRLVNIIQGLLDGRDVSKLYADGPCSKAQIIKNNWFK